MKHRMLGVSALVVLMLLSACGSATAVTPVETQSAVEQATTEETTPAEEAPAPEVPVEEGSGEQASAVVPENGPYMPLTADAEILTTNPVNKEPFPQTDIQVMYLSDLEIPAAQEELTARYTAAGWTVVSEKSMSTVSLIATAPSTSTWKGGCSMGLQKGSPEVMGTPKLVIKGMCYPK